jgi:hypothetical protein
MGYRECKAGLLKTYGKKVEILIDEIIDPYIDGTFCMFDGFENDDSTAFSADLCDVVENRPTFIVSHDDIYNLAHFMNDAGNVWTMLLLSGQIGDTSVLLNIDGLNYQGASGGTPHRVMNTADEGKSDSFFLGFFFIMILISYLLHISYTHIYINTYTHIHRHTSVHIRTSLLNMVQ